MVFVTSDPHGHRDVLVQALSNAGLLAADGSWSGGEQSLWVLGDLLDRGPEGVGVVDLVMRLEQEASSSGGHVGMVLGNHEVLALAMHRFGGRPSTDAAVQSLVLSWQRNGGRVEDQQALEPRHIEWLQALPALVDLDGVLLMHSDTREYLTYGDDIQAINAAITAVLGSDDIAAWWECIHRLTDRYAFARDGGSAVADEMMSALGVDRMVHGHSVIADLRGIEPSDTDAALLYAGRRVLAIDGGIYAGGPCLVVDIDRWPTQ
jgi:hypothetical protein